MNSEIIVAPVKKLCPSNAQITDESEISYYWKTLLQYWKLPTHLKHFPGPNPVSIERKDLKRLEDEDFLIALKTDGVRQLLLLTTRPNSSEPITLMIDRALNMFEIEVWASEEFFIKGSLFDGELVWNNEDNLVFMVFDVVFIKGIRCTKMSYSERLNIINQSILTIDITTENETIEQYILEEDKIIAKNNDDNLQISPKNCIQKFMIKELWSSNDLCLHRNDGVIFTLNSAGITTGTSANIFKWKPSHSIDIKAYYTNKVWSIKGNDNNSDYEIDISTKCGKYDVVITENKLLNCLENRQPCVIECKIEITNNTVTLTAERERSDKKTANTMKTIEATILNATEHITIEEVFAALKSGV